jgi:hypothetical protein
VDDFLVGLLALVVGLVFCFRGYLAMRVVIPIWGGFAGFMFGAGLVDSFSDDGFLASALGWVVGIAMALLFALLAYFYYEISVVIVRGASGFTLGSTVMVALGVTWSWVIILVGLAAGAILAVVAVVGDLPMALLTILTALAGASAAVTGLMLIFGVISLEDFDSVATTERLDDDWWWYVIFGVLVFAGMVAQIRTLRNLRSSLREAWVDSGGGQLRQNPI